METIVEEQKTSEPMKAVGLSTMMSTIVEDEEENNRNTFVPGDKNSNSIDLNVSQRQAVEQPKP